MFLKYIQVPTFQISRKVSAKGQRVARGGYSKKILNKNTAVLRRAFSVEVNRAAYHYFSNLQNTL